VVSGGILAVLPRVEQFDWHFLVQNLLVVLAWLLTLALVHAAVRPSLVVTAKGPATVAALAAPLMSVIANAAHAARIFCFIVPIFNKRIIKNKCFFF
jgi:hypothetical protein